jgi:Regulator of chromosome condensation (RCC1) repeat
MDPPADTFTQIVTSPDALTVCGLHPDGTIGCWGYNDEGEANPPAGSFTEIAMGQKFGCALTATGSAVCWGADDSGQTSPRLKILSVRSAAATVSPAALPRASRSCAGASGDRAPSSRAGRSARSA